MKKDIKALDHRALVSWLTQHQVRSFRAEQILKWVYVRLADDFHQMTDLRKDLRQMLDEHFCIARMPAVRIVDSADGARKFLFRLYDGHTVESVLIPERDHFTLCVSSQVGCAQKCRFCMTAKGGFLRNLSSAEIIDQVWEVRKQMPNADQLTNLVFMGMGEPLANFANLVQALAVITNSDWGLKFSTRRVTVSTAGLVPRMLDLGNATRVNLAVSLNAVDNETRSRLMPINRQYPIEALLDACKRYPLARGRKITFEYILMAHVNDSPAEARQLVKLLAPLKAKINLIPFNEHPGSVFQRPSEARIQAFQSLLIAKHFTSIVRYSKGQDIMAACGQLSADQH